MDPIFEIYVQFAIDWWCRFTNLIKNSLRKWLSKIGQIKKKTQFFENHPGVKGLIRHVKNDIFCEETLDICELCRNQGKNTKIEKKCDFSTLSIIRHVKNDIFCQKTLDICELCRNQDKNTKIEKKCDFSTLSITL